MKKINTEMEKLISVESRTWKPSSGKQKRQDYTQNGETEKQQTDLHYKAIWLWGELEAMYPGDWVSKTGKPLIEKDGVKHISPAANRWVSCASGYKRHDILLALNYLLDYANDRFLPRLGEFKTCLSDAKRLRIQREAEARAKSAVKIEAKPPSLEMRIKSLKVKIKALRDVGLMMRKQAYSACNNLALLESGIDPQILFSGGRS